MLVRCARSVPRQSLRVQINILCSCRESSATSKKNAEKHEVKDTPLQLRWNSIISSWRNLGLKALHARYQLTKHVQQVRSAMKDAESKFEEQEAQARSNIAGSATLTPQQAEQLPSRREQHRLRLSRKLEFYFDSLQETLFTATRALNDVTGYSSIQKLKSNIKDMEHRLEAVKERRRKYKDAYSGAIDARNSTQMQLNELLQRKNRWSPTDLEKFTQLYKEDAQNNDRTQELKIKVKEVETEEEQLSDNLYRAILTRYHEEQIWSDKIRRTSTWGTFVLMGINILLFMIVQLMLEPWKRRRLTAAFEDKVTMAIDKYFQDNKEEKLPSPKTEKELVSHGEATESINEKVSEETETITGNDQTHLFDWISNFNNSQYKWPAASACTFLLGVLIGASRGQ